MIEPNSLDWTLEEAEAAVAVLEKIRFSHKAGKGVPARVYEAHVGSKLNVSFESVPVRRKDGTLQVYLIRRPTAAENPSEPYPGKLHSPGVTRVVDETREQALERLIQREFGGIRPERVIPVANLEDADPPRPLYELQVHLLLMGEDALPKNPRGRWYSLEEFDPKELVGSHQKFIPLALEKFKEGWQ